MLKHNAHKRRVVDKIDLKQVKVELQLLKSSSLKKAIRERKDAKEDGSVTTGEQWHCVLKPLAEGETLEFPTMAARKESFSLHNESQEDSVQNK